MSDIQDKVVTVVRSVLGNDEITIDSDLAKDFGLDHLDAVEILLDLEDDLNIVIDDDSYEFTTVRELVDIVSKHV